KELPTYVLDHPNYIYKNNGDLTFKDMRDDWGIYYPSITYGGGYADLDNDGDMDIVVSNVNQSPWVYRNNLEKMNSGNNWIQFKFKGYAKNSGGLGTKVKIYCGDQMQYIQHTSARGYITTIQDDVHFGLGTAAKIDLVEVEWLDGSKQILRDVEVNKIMTLNHVNASKSVVFEDHNKIAPTFKRATDELATDYMHKEADYDDFLREYLLPHKMSTLGPGIAVADINSDGLDDFYIGGSAGQSGAIFTQGADGKFTRSTWQQTAKDGLASEDQGVLFFDADNDGDQDLYVASGSNEYAANDPKYADRLYSNDGKGGFSINTGALPQNNSSKSVVTAADYDKDGDMDLFLGGRQVPGKFLAPASSNILQNNGGKFTDVTAQVAPMLKDIGMITSGIWTDFDNDNNIDLIITGDWMAITFLKNSSGKFTDVTNKTGLDNATGWWQSILGADVDNDGDMDYVVGNFGTNRRYKNTTAADGHALPLEAYLYDFDNNGTEDYIMCYYQHDKLFPVKTRERLIEELPGIDKQFPTWDAFGKATMQEIFGDDLNKAIHRNAYIFHSSVLVNEGNGKFTIKFLPNDAQISPLFGMVADDFNEDGITDILMHGNFYNTEIEITRHDAGSGLLLLGKGDGTFTAQRSFISGFRNQGDAKGLACLVNSNGQPVYLAANSNGKMESFNLVRTTKMIELASNDAYAIITMKDGKKSKSELYAGSGYLSQSAKYIRITPNISSIEVYDYKGNMRSVYPSSTASK
ncbi:MAG: VCBS repeat-containing protein, partial [Chitinophagales bacterium]